MDPEEVKAKTDQLKEKPNDEDKHDEDKHDEDKHDEDKPKDGRQDGQ